MSDLIKREDAVQVIRKTLGSLGNSVVIEINSLSGYIPSAEAVQVVRCKDCKYWHGNTEFCDMWSHLNIAQRTLADDYCSLGERKGGDSK